MHLLRNPLRLFFFILKANYSYESSTGAGYRKYWVFFSLINIITEGKMSVMITNQ